MSKEGENSTGTSRTRVSPAGVLTRKAKRLLDLLNDDDLEGAVKVWRAGLAATRTFYDAGSKSMIDGPDWKERRECAMAIAMYMEGKPIERQVQITGKFEELNEMMSRLSGSPAAFRAIERTGLKPKLLTEGTQGNELGEEKAASPKGRRPKKDSKS